MIKKLSLNSKPLDLMALRNSRRVLGIDMIKKTKDPHIEAVLNSVLYRADLFVFAIRSLMKIPLTKKNDKLKTLESERTISLSVTPKYLYLEKKLRPTKFLRRP